MIINITLISFLLQKSYKSVANNGLEKNSKICWNIIFFEKFLIVAQDIQKYILHVLIWIEQNNWNSENKIDGNSIWASLFVKVCQFIFWKLTKFKIYLQILPHYWKKVYCRDFKYFKSILFYWRVGLQNYWIVDF